MADARARIVLTAEDQTRTAFQSVQANLKSMQQSLAQIRTVGGAIIGNEIVQSLGNGARAIVQARVEFEKLQNTLGQAVGVGQVGRELNFIRTAAGRLGLEFNSTAQSYAKFAAASRGTALEGAATREIFTGIAQASAALGLSSEETAGALTAVQQIISKGKVSAEELRGQLGERLPGAFQIAARSIGVTTQELDRLLASGSLLADDFLPKFARQLQLEFADAAARAANSTQASINKLETAWGELKRTLSTGVAGDVLKLGIDETTAAIQRLGTATKQVEENSTSFLGNLIELARLIPSTSLRALAAVGQGQLNAAGNAGAISEANDAILARRAAERPAGVTASTLAGLRRLDNGQIAGQTTQANEELRKLLGGLRTPEQIQADQIAELRRLGALTGTDVSGGIAEINRRAGESAAKKAASDAKAYIDSLKEQIAKTTELTAVERTLREIREGRLAGASPSDQVGALGLAGTIDDNQRQADAAERALRALERFEELDAAQGAANEALEARIRGEVEAFQLLADPARKYREELARINELQAQGRFATPEEATLARTAVQEKIDELARIRQQTREADDAVRELGLTFTSAFEDAVAEGKGLRVVMQGLVQDLARLATRRLVTEPLLGALSGLFGGGGGAAGSTGVDIFSRLPYAPFADGGVMTARGPLPLRRYAAGGVARSAQLALYGEGSMAEAFVPLPDGRSIPVTVSGGGRPVQQQFTFARDRTPGQRLREAEMIKASTMRAMREQTERGAA